MAIHDLNNFGNEEDQSFVPPKSSELPNIQTDPKLSPVPIQSPSKIITPYNHDERDNFHYDESRIIDDRISTNFHEEVRELAVPGFKLMDKGIKNYFSGIRVPVGKNTEQFKMLNVIIAGSDESVFYADKSIVGGRKQLPMLSIARTGENFDPKRFTPAYLSFRTRYLSNRRMEQIFRPNPYLIDYTLEIWGEHKHDVEYILYMITSRFNPVASFLIEDQNLNYEVIMKTNGVSDQSDIEADAESHAEVKYSISIQMEGWLPLPTKIVPTVLSKPLTISEGIADQYGRIIAQGDILDAQRDDSNNSNNNT